jgi:hypothetical protein
MSALPPKADIRQRIEHVCFVPIADIAQQAVVVAARQFTTYKVLGFRWSLLGAVMHGSLLLQLLILLVVANGTAVGAKKLLGAAFGRPLDGGALFVDGQPIFGPSKTIRGIVVSVLATSICAVLMGLGWEVGTLVATFAMAGDLFSSFVKRRLHLASSSMAIGLDHIPESLFPLLASRLLLPLSTLDIVVGVTIFVIGALILSPLLFKLNLRDEPH